MKLIRRDPVLDLPAFRSLWRDWPERFHFPEMVVLDEDEMKVDEYQENGNLVIRAEMPGVDPENDIDLEVSDGRLTIRAERRREEETEERNYYRCEMHYGAFSRSLPLPAGVEEDDIKASYANGILEIRVPTPAERQPAAKQKIKVERTTP